MRDTWARHLHRLLVDRSIIAALRGRLREEGGLPLRRLSDHAVIDLVADRLVRCALCLAAPEPRPRDAALPSAGSPGAAAGNQGSPPPANTGPAATPSALRPRQEAAAAPPPAEGDPFAGLDQDVQAAALQHAANAGMPFCEQCRGGGSG